MLKTLLNFLLIVLLFTSTIGYVGYQLLKPGFLVHQAEKVHLYEQTTAQVGTFLPKDATNDLPFSTAEIQTILSKGIDANTFYTTLDQASTAYLNYITSRSSKVSYSLNLIPLKTTVGDQAKATLSANYQSLPICKTSELKSWDATNSFPSCQLPTTNVQSRDVDALLGSQVDKILANLPDRWSAPPPSAGLSQTRERITQVLGLIRIAWLATLAVILLYILAFRKRAFLPLAFIFLVVGALEVAFSLVAWDYLKRLILDLVSHPDTSQQIISIAGTIADDIVQTLKTILGNLSIITLSIGGFFLIIWGFTRFGRAKKEPALEIPRG